MTKILKSLTPLTLLGILLLFVVVAPLTIPVKTLAATSLEAQVPPSSINSDNDTIHSGPWDNDPALSLEDFFNSYGTAYWFWNFLDGNLYSGDHSSLEPTFTIDSPSDGDIWTAGSQQTIRWTYTGNPEPNIKIELFKGGVFYRAIASTTPVGTDGSGFYNWTIPFSEIPGNDFQIIVTGITDSACTGSSKNTFTILKAPITISSPKDSESCLAGRSQEIAWRCSGNAGPFVKIELLKDGVYYQTITSQTPAGSYGSGRCYYWIIPSSQAPGDKFQIKITSTSNTTCTATSEGNFRITGQPFVVTSPGDGEGLARGTQYPITWLYNNSPGPYVKIDLFKDGVFQRPIAANVPIGWGGAGYYLWTVSTSQVLGDNYQIRVTSTTDSSCTGLSGNSFYIYAP
jgi:hypothetical protein